MNITYNHIIKFFLLSGVCVLSAIGNYQIYSSGIFDVEVNVFTIVAGIIDIIAVTLIMAQLIMLMIRWGSGCFDDVLDKPLFKLPGKTSLIEDLKSHLEEAQRINDVEEITRLRNSIEIIEKYR